MLVHDVSGHVIDVEIRPLTCLVSPATSDVSLYLQLQGISGSQFCTGPEL